MYIAILLYRAGVFPSNMQFDQEMLSLEDSLTKAFDAVIRLQVDPVWNQLVRRQVEMGLMTDFVHVEQLIDGFHSHFRVLRLNNWSLISRLFVLYCSEFVGA